MTSEPFWCARVAACIVRAEPPSGGCRDAAFATHAHCGDLWAWKLEVAICDTRVACLDLHLLRRAGVRIMYISLGHSFLHCCILRSPLKCGPIDWRCWHKPAGVPNPQRRHMATATSSRRGWRGYAYQKDDAAALVDGRIRASDLCSLHTIDGVPPLPRRRGLELRSLSDRTHSSTWLWIRFQPPHRIRRGVETNSAVRLAIHASRQLASSFHLSELQGSTASFLFGPYGPPSKRETRAENRTLPA